MIWAESVIVGATLVGVGALIAMAVGLWRRVKAFTRLLASASETLSEATAGLAAAQSAGSGRTGRERPSPGVH